MTTQSNPENTPHILVLGIGGTIAGLAQGPSRPTAYKAGQVEIEVLLERIGADTLGSLNLVSRQLANIDSRDLSEELLTQMGKAVRDALLNPLTVGIVITHGDTVEEVGFFLDSTCGKLAQKLGKRVVFTGAMLPSNAARADGPQNFLDALKWASSAPENCPGWGYLRFLLARLAWRAIWQSATLVPSMPH